MNFTSLFSATPTVTPASTPPTSAANLATVRAKRLTTTVQPDSVECSRVRYSIDMIRDEVRHLVQQGKLSRYQPLYALCQYVPAREWVCIEQTLADHEFLLREQILDLLGREDWEND